MNHPVTRGRAIHLMPVGLAADRDSAPQIGALDRLAAPLARLFEVSCHVRTELVDAAFAHDPVRNQYHSTAILARLEALQQDILPAHPGADIRLLGITAFDLFVPVLTFVFGEAQLQGRCGIVSFHRLREEYYGLPAREEALEERLAKEAVHELGHTYGLRHCSDWRCVMASTHSVERLDLKGMDFCGACAKAIR